MKEQSFGRKENQVLFQKHKGSSSSFLFKKRKEDEVFGTKFLKKRRPGFVSQGTKDQKKNQKKKKTRRRTRRRRRQEEEQLTTNN